MLPNRNFINQLLLVENEDEHTDVTCYGGSDGVIEVYACWGQPPYQYSLDGETWQNSGHFDNLSVPNGAVVARKGRNAVEYITTYGDNYVTSGYNHILVGNQRIYCKDSAGTVQYADFQLRSPAEFGFVFDPQPDYILYDSANDSWSNIMLLDEGKNYATVIQDVNFSTPVANTPSIVSRTTNIRIADKYNEGVTPIRFTIRDRTCGGGTKNFYLNVVVFPSFLPNAVQDYDGNWYDAVILGNHVWLANNLKVTHYADGTAIDSNYYYIPNDEGVDGYLYSYPGACRRQSCFTMERIQGIAPDGWHIPNELEIYDMMNFVASQDGWAVGGNANNIAKALSSTTNIYNSNNDDGDYPFNNPTTNNISKFNGVFDGFVQKRSGIVSYGARTAEFDMLISNNYVHTQFPETYVSDISFMLRFSSKKFERRFLPRRYDYDRYTMFSVRCVSDLTPLEFCKWYFTQYGTTNHQLS